MSAVEGSTHSLSCLAEGDPTPLVTWSRDLQVLSTNGILTFDVLARSNGGTYTCTASNNAGVISQDVNLDILCESLEDLANVLYEVLFYRISLCVILHACILLMN